MLIRRDTHVTTITIPSGGNLADQALPMSRFSMLTVHMPAAWTAAAIGFKVSSDENGTYLPLYDDAGAIVEITVAVSQAHIAPADVAGALWVKLWSQNSGSNANQGAERSLIVTLKG